jgi:hypothetical protein
MTTSTASAQPAHRPRAGRARVRAALTGARGWGRTRAERRAELRRDAAVLRPGLWLTSEPRLSRHWRQRSLPVQLAARVHHLPPEPRLRLRLRYLARDLLSLVWIPRVRQDPAAAQVGRFPIHLPSTYSPEAVLFDPARSKVLRLRHDTSSQLRIEVPRRFSGHLDVAPFEVIGDGRYLLAELVTGVSMRDVTDEARRAAAVRSLLDGYTSLAGAEREGSSRELVAAAVEAAEAADIPAELRAWLSSNGADVVERASSWPLVPSHADLITGNVVLAEDGPVLVDFEWAAYRPFFFDPLSLILSDASEHGRTDLLRDLLGHRHDDRLKTLCAAAGCPSEPPRTLLIVTLLVRSHAASPGTAPADRARFGRYVRRAWAPLALGTTGETR